MPDWIARMCRTASTTLPVPASPFVRIIAAPSAIRRSASPRSVAPHTNGTLERPLVDVVRLVGRREHLGLVDVVDLERLEHLGLDEVADARLGHHGDRHGLLDLADLGRGCAMRATPPWARMSAGTRSSAITAQAPACSAITACSASVTSMMTPPLSISASPLLTRKVASSRMEVSLTGAFGSPGLSRRGALGAPVSRAWRMPADYFSLYARIRSWYAASSLE